MWAMILYEDRDLLPQSYRSMVSRSGRRNRSKVLEVIARLRDKI